MTCLMNVFSVDHRFGNLIEMCNSDDATITVKKERHLKCSLLSFILVTQSFLDLLYISVRPELPVPVLLHVVFYT